MEKVKIIYDLMISVGWQPIPLLVATGVTIFIRKTFEVDVIQTTTHTDKLKRDVARLGSVVIAIITAWLVQYGLTRPDDKFDRAVCWGIAVGDAAVGYVLYSIYDAADVINRVKRYLDRRNGNATGNTGS